MAFNLNVKFRLFALIKSKMNLTSIDTLETWPRYSQDRADVANSANSI